MENNVEHLTEDHHFEIRERMQAELIRDFYGLNNPDEVSNEQAYRWVESHSQAFGTAFSSVASKRLSFWNDAEQDFEGAVELVKQKIAEEEGVLKVN